MSYLLSIALIGRLLPRSMNDCEMRVWRRCFRLTHMGGCDRAILLLLLLHPWAAGIRARYTRGAPISLSAVNYSQRPGFSTAGTQQLPQNSSLCAYRGEALRARGIQSTPARATKPTVPFIFTEDNTEEKISKLYTKIRKPAIEWRQHA